VKVRVDNGYCKSFSSIPKGRNLDKSPLFLIMSLTILLEIKVCSGKVRIKTVSIYFLIIYLFCPIALSNSKSAEVRKPLKINLQLLFLQKSTVNPE